jgi:DNA-binding CsgD family transcriptional regulator
VSASQTPSAPHAPRLLGRESECAALDALLASVRDGPSRALVLRGEAGVGKSALLAYLAAKASACTVARVAGVESEIELAFAGLHQLCAPFVDRLDRLPGPQRDALETVFGRSAGAAPDRFMVGLATLTLLAEHEPLVCIVEDAQWLDRASAQILGFVARRILAESIALVCAVRTDAADDVLQGLPELDVRGLGESDARALLLGNVRGPLDAAVCDQILRESHGNPLALLELPRTWDVVGVAGGFGLPDGQPLSGKIERSYASRLSKLPPDTRLLVLAAAADPLGDPVLLHRAAQSLGLEMAAAGPALDAGLLRLGGRVEFPHPLARSAAYGGADPADRQRVHRALADATDAETDPDRRAWHRARGTPGHGEDIAAELERSADRARARGGVAAAAAFLQRAVALTADPARRTERALAAAETSFQAGDFDAAQAFLAAAESGSLEGLPRARAGLLRGHVALVLGYGADAAPLLLQAARQLEPIDLELARGAYLTAYASAMSASHLAHAGVFLDICRAIEALPRSESPAALLLEGLARMHTDGRAVAIPILQGAQDAVAHLPAEDVLRWGWIAPMASHVTWDPERSTAIHERQARIVRDAGALAELPVYLTALALDRVWNGDLAEAHSLIAEADGVAAVTGSRLPPFAALRLRALLGKEAEASALIAATIEHGTAAGQGLAVTVAQWAAAVLYNGLGRHEEAASHARQVTADDVDPYPHMWVLPELVEAAARTGQSEVAHQALARLSQMTLPAGTDWALATEARSRALLADGESAERLYREAIERFARTTLRPELARAYLLYGEWLSRRDRRVEARATLRAAFEQFLAIGMEAFADRARRELAATGESVRRERARNHHALTPQEEQIARLARDGFSNPEIGAQLFISARTVEWHLGKVFAKLGISSRSGLRTALPRPERERTVA